MTMISVSHAHEGGAKPIAASSKHWAHVHIDVSKGVELILKRMRAGHKGMIVGCTKRSRLIKVVLMYVILFKSACSILIDFLILDEIIFVIEVIIVWFAHNINDIEEWKGG